MSKPIHTPGPWVIGDRKPDSHATRICTIVGGSAIHGAAQAVDDWQADAKLIAAAPELLEALQELRDLMQGVIDGDYEPDSLTLQIADAAIAKSTA
jgi:hypothetical protein